LFDCLMALVLFVLAGSAVARAQRVTLALRTADFADTAIDAGPVPASQPMQITVRLAMSSDRSAALDQLLANQMSASSASFHQWLTPQQFGAEFGTSDEQLATVTAWLESYGLSVGAISTSRTRITVTGSAMQVQTAFDVVLRRYQVGNAIYFANSTQPSLPQSMASVIADVDGLNEIPQIAPMSVAGFTSAGPIAIPAVQGADAYLVAATAIDANTAPMVTFASSACSTDFVQSDYYDYRDLFRQANAQGITILATSGCGVRGTGSFPASLAEVTALMVSPVTAAFIAIAPRPAWQSAPGLPVDDSRYEPDLTASTLSDFARAVSAIVQQGGRQGNINATLYGLAPVEGLYTQPDASATTAPGTWEPPTGLGVIDLDSLLKAYPRGSNGSATVMSSSSYSLVHGQSLTLTGTVSAASGTFAPSGTVTFSSAQTGVLGVARLNAAGVASFTTNGLPGGVYSIRANYIGDANYAGSSSGVATVTVQREVARISAVVLPGAVLGGNVTIKVTVASTSGVGTPGGSIVVAPQGTGSAATFTGALTAASTGLATSVVNVPATQVGGVNLLVSCSGDASFACGPPISVQAVVAKAASATSLAMARRSQIAGMPVTLTASVPAVGTTPATGKVVFMDSSKALSSVALSSGVATFTGVVAAGKHSFTASYAGDTNFASSVSVAVDASDDGVSTGTTLTSSIYTVNYGQPIILTTVVTPSSLVNGLAPTGTVTFSSSQGTIGSATLASGTATQTINSLSAGTYTITATYSGDANYAASTSSNVIITVNMVNAGLAATISPEASVPYGATATVTATVILPSSSVAPVGTVSAQIENVTAARTTATLSPNSNGNSATANIVISAPSPGSYTVEVSCAGNQNFQCQSPVDITPFTTVKGYSLTALSVSPAAPQAGLPTTLTATVSNAGNGTGTYGFTGNVTFFDNGKLLGSSAVSTNQATLTVTLFGNVVHAITASYSGDANWNPSTSAAQSLSTSLLPSLLTLSSNIPANSTGLAGLNVVFTATVSSLVSAVADPTATITFYDTFNGSVILLGSSTLVPDGPSQSIAVLSTTNLLAGAHSVYGIYSGDNTFLTATSSVLPVIMSDYTVTMVPSTLTISGGSSGQASMVVGAVEGFTGSVTFGCTPPPNTEITCSFSPTTLNGGSGTTTMTVVTAASSTAAAEHAGLERRWNSVVGAALAVLFCFALPGRRRSLPKLLLLLCAVSVTCNLGCTAGTDTARVQTGSTTSGPGSPLGTQIVTVTTAGTTAAGTVRQIYQYQVTVQ
jgi:trimeric autotransporter adhesin